MSADTMPELTKIDSAVQGLEISPPEKKGHRRTSSSTTGVYNPAELEEKKIDIAIAPETQKLGWKINTSPTSIEDKEYLKIPLTKPLVKKMDLQFPYGLEVTARNMKGVTIKDALDAIYKHNKKKADDELDLPYLAGFEWDKTESWTRFIVHLKKEGAPPASKKSKKKAKEEAEA